MADPLIAITRKRALIFASFLVLYEFLTYIANDMIMPGMLDVVKSFHAPESAVATSLTAYVLGGASLQLILGPLSDAFGRRPVMLVGAVLFFVMTVLIACSNSIDQFLWARFFQGMGLCFISVVGYATLQEIFAEMDAIRLIAVMANISLLAPLIGPLLGALFVKHFSWRMIFVVIAVFALVTLWGLWRTMPEPVGQIKKDGGLIPRLPWKTKAILRNYWLLVTNSPFILGSVALGLLVMPCLVWIALAPVLLIEQAHMTVIDYGLWQIPLFGACILGNFTLHRLTHRTTLKGLIFYGSLLTGLSLFLCYLLPLLFNEQFIWLIPGLLLYFFALGLAGAPLTRFVLFVTSVTKGTASALMSMLTMAIQGLGIELGSWFYTLYHYSNLYFGLFCFLIGLTYGVVLLLTLYLAEGYLSDGRAIESL